jgi:hypothetical protein
MNTNIKSARTSLKIKSSVRAGALQSVNHNRTSLKIKSSVRAGALQSVNHNRALAR